MKRILNITICLFIANSFLISQKSFAIGDEMKDTYFHRFYYRSIIMGTSSVGKYNIDYIHGRNATAVGLILDFPNNFMNRLFKTENISQTAGLMIYGFDDKFKPGLPFEENSLTLITGTNMAAFSLSYGWNFYNLPLGINIYSGFNLYSGRKELALDNGEKSKEKFFAPAPYLYINKPWGEHLFTNFDFMLRHDYKDLAKAAGTILLRKMNFDVDFTTERNTAEYNDSYESSMMISKKFGSAWFFKHVIGIFSPKMRQLDDNEESFKETDKILGTPGYLKIKGGTAFTVNNLANEKFSDKINDSGNYFGKVELGYVLGVGFSYKVEEGFGWKFGFNYSIDLDAAGASDGADVRTGKMMKGKKAYVILEYYRNFICDDAFGMRIDPSMFRINLMIR